jgi:hypothetical protein
MAKAYFATKLSDNIAKTPEGYLLCLNVPIARTGYQDYLPDEIGVEGNGLVKVYRSPEEVFAAATIASAEGKDVSDLHPSQWINPNNHGNFSKGHGQNVRKGEANDAEYLVCDLFIKDAVLISKVEGGQREVSCGYDCEYVKIEGGYAQKNIRINHIAIVPNGRAGKEVAIRDSKPIEKEIKLMGKSLMQRIFGMGLKEFAKDASPEEVAKAWEGSKEDEKEDKEGEEKLKESSKDMKAVLDGIKSISDRLAIIEAKDAENKEAKEESALDAMEKELEKASKGCDAEANEEEKAKAKEAADAELAAASVLSGNEIPTNPIPGADAALSLLRTMKPIIAGITDAGARKQASDALLASVKGMMPTSTQTASYGALLQAKAADAKAAVADPADLGKAIKAQFHKKPINVR